jgi:hypothetical protein
VANAQIVNFVSFLKNSAHFKGSTRGLKVHTARGGSSGRLLLQQQQQRRKRRRIQARLAVDAEEEEEEGKVEWSPTPAATATTTTTWEFQQQQQQEREPEQEQEQRQEQQELMEVGVMSSTSNGLPRSSSNGNGATAAAAGNGATAAAASNGAAAAAAAAAAVTLEKNANNKTTNGAALSTAAEIQKKPQKGKVESIGQEDPWFKQATSKGVKVLPLPLTHLVFCFRFIPPITEESKSIIVSWAHFPSPLSQLIPPLSLLLFLASIHPSFIHKCRISPKILPS